VNSTKLKNKVVAIFRELPKESDKEKWKFYRIEARFFPSTSSGQAQQRRVLPRMTCRGDCFGQSGFLGFEFNSSKPKS
jgi:hypothetical protein